MQEWHDCQDGINTIELNIVMNLSTVPLRFEVFAALVLGEDSGRLWCHAE
jgi:hypothetical protein